jgi:hypothetical protein
VNQHDVMTAQVDPDGRWLYRVAGICAIVLCVGYLVAIPIYAVVGDQPAAGLDAQLAYFGEHATGWWSIVGLMVFTDLLYIPVFFGMYTALKHINRGLMLFSLAFAAFLFVILDLAVTWTAYSTMTAAGAQYAVATTDAERTALVAAAAYPAAILRGNPVLGTYAILIPSIGVLFAGLVMLKGVFNRTTAYLALATGFTGILYMSSYAVDGLAVLRYVNALLATAFYLLVGVRLYKLGRQ